MEIINGAIFVLLIKVLGERNHSIFGVTYTRKNLKSHFTSFWVLLTLVAQAV